MEQSDYKIHHYHTKLQNDYGENNMIMKPMIYDQKLLS